MRRPLALVVVSFALSIAGSAEAQSPHATSLADSLHGEAKSAYDEARRLFKAGDFKGCVDALTRAQKLEPDPRLFWNLAACEKKLGHHARALNLVDRYLAAGGSILSDAERREAQDFINAMKTLVGTVTVTSALDGVQLFVDDELVGSTPFAKALFVDGGEHRIRGTRAGYVSVARVETVPAGGAVSWVLELARENHEGHLVVSAGPSESIWVDGVLMGRGEWGGNVQSGTHQVAVTAQGKPSRDQAVEIKDGEARTVDLHLAASPQGDHTWWYVGGGVLVAAIGATIGGYFLFKQSPSSPSDPRGTLGTYSFP